MMLNNKAVDHVYNIEYLRTKWFNLLNLEMKIQMEHAVHIIVYVENTIVQVGNDYHCCIYITKDLYMYMFYNTMFHNCGTFCIFLNFHF